MANIFLEKLEGVKRRFEEVQETLNLPEIMSDQKRYVRLNKEYRDLEPLIDDFDKYKDILSNIDSAK